MHFQTSLTINSGLLLTSPFRPAITSCALFSGTTAVASVRVLPVLCSWMESRLRREEFPITIGIRFSLDETFDVGEDKGTPVIEDYADKMPFAFTGTLKKFVVVLEPQKLTEEERKRLLEEEARAYMAVH